MILCCQILNSLLQFSAEVSLKHHYVLLFLYVHVSAALDLAMFVGGDTPVLTRVRFRHFSDLQFGLLALLFNGDPATVGHLPPLPFHPLHTGNGVTTHLCDEGGGSLCEQQVEELDQKCLRFYTFGLCIVQMLRPSLSVTCAVLGSSMKNRLSIFLDGEAAGASAGDRAAPGFSARWQTTNERFSKATKIWIFQLLRNKKNYK